MTDPVVSIEPAELSVEPGGQARAEVTVRNPGSIVEEYRLEVISEQPGEGPDAWAEAYPAELRVYPKEKASASIVFAPPAGSTTASGRFAFAVRAASTVTDDVSAVCEGDIEVGRVFGLQATITPMTSWGRWRGRHVLRYTNWGNSPARLQLSARDPDERLGFLLRPTDVDLALGASAEARLTVRTRKPFLRGTAVRLPFEVVGEQGRSAAKPAGAPVAADPRRPVLTGALMQKPILSRTTVAIAGLAAAAVAGALVLALRAPKNTPTYEAEGAPVPPGAVSALARPNGTVQVSWASVRHVEGYRVVTLLGSTGVSVTQVPAEQQLYTTPVLAAATRYCFEVVSVRGKLHSALSRKVCRSTVAPPPPSGSGSSGPSTSSLPPSSSTPATPPTSGGSSGSGTSTSASPGAPDSFTPDQWIVVMGQFFPDDPGNGPRLKAEQEAIDLTVEGLPVHAILHSTDYPKLEIFGSLPRAPFWAVYAGPFDAAGAAAFQSSCHSSSGEVCTLVQPNPS